MEKHSKLSLQIFLSITLIAITYALVAMFLHDPLQIWHKPFFRSKLTYSYTMRESARAFIRDYKFDSVIMGNSLFENISAQKAKEILGGKFFNLSISGGTMYEKHLILNYLLKRRKIKTVIINPNANCTNLGITPRLFDINQYNFLYNNNPFDDFKIYLNDKLFWGTLCFSNNKKYIGNPKDIDKPYAWEGNKSHYSRFGGFDKWVENKNNNQIKDNFKSIVDTPSEIKEVTIDNKFLIEMKNYYDKYFFSLVAKYPDTNFYMIITPVSDIALAQKVRKGELTKEFEVLKYLTSQQSVYKNYHLFVFSDSKELSQVKDYKDTTHFRTWINYYMLESIKKDKHRLTPQNIDNYISTVYNNAISVDFDYYKNKVQGIVKD